jgi:hypothetical protein
MNGPANLPNPIVDLIIGKRAKKLPTEFVAFSDYLLHLSKSGILGLSIGAGPKNDTWHIHVSKQRTKHPDYRILINGMKLRSVRLRR